jgi:hypothetical protein
MNLLTVLFCWNFLVSIWFISRSQWPRCLRRRSAAARLLRLWFRILPGAWLSVLCEYCVLSGRVLCDELITCPEGSYRLWCVVVCDLKPHELGVHGPRWAAASQRKKICLINWEGSERLDLRSVLRNWELQKLQCRGLGVPDPEVDGHLPSSGTRRFMIVSRKSWRWSLYWAR